jgi:hypothetical protein
MALAMWERRDCLNFVSEASKAVGGTLSAGWPDKTCDETKYSLMFPK